MVMFCTKEKCQNGTKTGRAALVIAICHRAASIGLHAKLAVGFRPISEMP